MQRRIESAVGCRFSGIDDSKEERLILTTGYEVVATLGDRSMLATVMQLLNRPDPYIFDGFFLQPSWDDVTWCSKSKEALRMTVLI